MMLVIRIDFTCQVAPCILQIIVKSSVRLFVRIGTQPFLRYPTRLLLKLATPFLWLSSLTLIFQNATKPRAVAVNDLAKRLRSINQMMQYLPGANKAAPYNDQERKMIFYQMMPSDWELTFLKTGRQLTDATQSLTDLARYMKLHESVLASRRGEELSR